VLATLVAACGSSGGGPRLGDTFVLGVGDTTTIGDLNLLVRFAQVAADSRCPTQGACVWAGDAAVVLEITPYLAASRFDTLHTTLDPQSVDVGKVELHLVLLDPYPVTAGSIPLRAYRLTLVAREIPLD